MLSVRERLVDVTVLIAVVCAGSSALPVSAAPADTSASWADVVLYQVFTRSFYDSDGDGHGDLAGIRAKLGYLQAFEWHADGSDSGQANWYRDSGPWWDHRNAAPHDGISFEEQRNDPHSLWQHVRRLARLRANVSALRRGDTEVVRSDEEGVLAWARQAPSDTVFVLVNLQADSLAYRVPDSYRRFERPLLEGSPCAAPSDGLLRLASFATVVCGR